MIRYLLGRVIRWAAPLDMWCPCLEHVVARSRLAGHAVKRMRVEQREPEAPVFVPIEQKDVEPEYRPMRAFGSMYLKVKEH